MVSGIFAPMQVSTLLLGQLVLMGGGMVGDEFKMKENLHVPFITNIRCPFSCKVKDGDTFLFDVNYVHC